MVLVCIVLSQQDSSRHQHDELIGALISVSATSRNGTEDFGWATKSCEDADQTIQTNATL